MPAPQANIFDADIRLQSLSAHSDPLLKLNKHINWEIFRPILNQLEKTDAETRKGGRPSYDNILLFKMLILQKMYGLSDFQLQYQVMDRLSFMRFLGLTISHRVPDQNTVWNFREKIKEKALDNSLFEVFFEKLKSEGLILNEGKAIDATFIEAPKQRNSKEENEKVKKLEIPEDWEKNPNKLSQKDLDATWALKNKETHYGYKDHVMIDTGSKLIENYTVTDAAAHDSTEFINLVAKLEPIGVLDENGEPKKKHEIYADSAYRSKDIEDIISLRKATSQIHEKGYKNKPLTEQQQENNKIKSKIRVRVEHVFGYMVNTLGGTFVKSIGFARAKTHIGLLNLTYNLKRYICLIDPTPNKTPALG